MQYRVDAPPQIETWGPPISLNSPRLPTPDNPGFVSAQVLPNRGMMLLQVRAHLPELGEVDLLYVPDQETAGHILNSDDYHGNASYSFGGALLVPYANRIRGRHLPGTRTIETAIRGTQVRLPANSGGKRPGAEQYAMHGLILDQAFEEITRNTTADTDGVRAVLHAGDFRGHWISSADLTVEVLVGVTALTLSVTATNVGETRLPIGIGWHPYFAIPSGRRQQARLHIPASHRLLVNNYDEVLPTGEITDVRGTSYDFSMAGGAPLRELYLDDCYVGLKKNHRGETVLSTVDPAAGYGLRIVASSPQVSAVQTFAPTDRAFVVLEPQFNWADPYGPVWASDVDTGMVLLSPNQSVDYVVRLELFTPK